VDYDARMAEEENAYLGEGAMREGLE